MQLIILTGILLFTATKFNKFIKTHFNILCVVVTIFSILSYFIKNLNNIINAGFVGFAFFVVVMFQSAFKKRSNLYKKTLSIRKEYSIFGFIFLLPHVLIFLIGENQVLEWNGIISFFIMVPLFITSFIVIRKKMSAAHWKKLHLLSYIAYILMFAHVMSVNTSRFIYIVIIVLYLFLKVKNDSFIKLDIPYKKSIGFILLIIFICININIFVISNNFIDFKNNIYNDGIYYGEASGYAMKKVKVNIEIKNNSITNIEVIDFGGSEPQNGTDFEQSVHELKNQILESQSLDVDAISGATKSTTGLKKAINNALKKAVVTDKEK